MADNSDPSIKQNAAESVITPIQDPMSLRDTDTGNLKRLTPGKAKKTIKLKPLTAKGSASMSATEVPSPEAAPASTSASEVKTATAVPKIIGGAASATGRQTVQLKPSSTGIVRPLTAKSSSATIKITPKMQSMQQNAAAAATDADSTPATGQETINLAANAAPKPAILKPASSKSGIITVPGAASKSAILIKPVEKKAETTAVSPGEETIHLGPAITPAAPTMAKPIAPLLKPAAATGMHPIQVPAKDESKTEPNQEVGEEKEVDSSTVKISAKAMVVSPLTPKTGLTPVAGTPSPTATIPDSAPAPALTPKPLLTPKPGLSPIGGAPAPAPALTPKPGLTPIGGAPAPAPALTPKPLMATKSGLTPAGGTPTPAPAPKPLLAPKTGLNPVPKAPEAAAAAPKPLLSPVSPLTKTASSLSIPQPAEAAAGGDAPAAAEPKKPGLSLAKKETTAEEAKAAAAPMAELKPAKNKTGGKAKPGTDEDVLEPGIFMSMGAMLATLCIVCSLAMVSVQFLNHWQGKDFKLPGLENIADTDVLGKIGLGKKNETADKTESQPAKTADKAQAPAGTPAK